jgi:hypothetical protein
MHARRRRERETLHEWRVLTIGGLVVFASGALRGFSGQLFGMSDTVALLGAGALAVAMWQVFTATRPGKAISLLPQYRRLLAFTLVLMVPGVATGEEAGRTPYGLPEGAMVAVTHMPS